MSYNRRIILSIILILIIFLPIFVFGIHNSHENNQTEVTNPTILLKARHFTPEAGLSKLAREEIQSRRVDENTHLLINFKHQLTKEEKQRLSDLNVKLTNYIPNNNWYASIPNNVISNLINLDFINAIDVILPEYKLPSYLRDNNFGNWAMTNNGKVYLNVQFHKDIGLNQAKSLLEAFNIQVYNEIPEINVLTVLIDKDQINQLSHLDEVLWMEDIPPKPENELDQSQHHSHNLGEPIPALQPDCLAG